LVGGIEVELRIVVAAGVPVAEVARQVDSAVRYSIRRATGREINHLSIHVGGVRFEATGKAAPDDGPGWPGLQPDEPDVAVVAPPADGPAEA